MNLEQLKQIVEAAIMAAGEPISLDRLSRVFDPQLTTKELRTVIDQLKADYQSRSIELKEIASGFRFQVRAEFAPWISKLWEERPARYSRAVLETLALIAYRQPITRAEIEDIRGVAVSSHIVKTLTDREWVKVVGHRDVPGRPAIFATTKEFLDYFNLQSLDQLPALTQLQEIEEMAEQLELQQLNLEVAAATATTTVSTTPEETPIPEEIN